MNDYDGLKFWEVDGALINKWFAGTSDLEYEEGRLYTVFENGDINYIGGENQLLENTGMPLNSSDLKELDIPEEEFFFVYGYYDNDMDMEQTGVILVEPKLLTLEEALKEPVFASIDDYFYENREQFGYSLSDDVEFYELANYKKAEVMEKYEESDELYYCKSFDSIDDAKKDLEKIEENRENLPEKLAYKFMFNKQDEKPIGSIVTLNRIVGVNLPDIDEEEFINILEGKTDNWCIFGSDTRLPKPYMVLVNFEVVKKGTNIYDTEVKITGYEVM